MYFVELALYFLLLIGCILVFILNSLHSFLELFELEQMEMLGFNKLTEDFILVYIDPV